MDASNRLLHVYGKTPAGTAALRADRGAMPAQARRILILIDGKRSVGDLSKIFPVQTLETALAFLDERSYVECLQHFPQDNGGFGNSTRFAELEKPLELPHGATSHLQTRHYVMGGVVVLSLGLLASFYDGLGARRPAEHAPAAPVAVVAAAAPSPESNAAPPAANPAPGADTSASPPVDAPAPAPPVVAPAQTLAPAVVPDTPARAPVDAAVAAPAVAAGAADTTPPAAVEAVAGPRKPAERKAAHMRAAADAPATGGLPKPLPGFSQAAAHPDAAPAPAVAAVPPAPPPTPAAALKLRVRSQVTPLLPQQVRDRGINSGRVVVMLHVNPGGTVDEVELVSATPPDIYDEQMRRAFEDWTFYPLAVPGRMTVELDVGTPPHPAQP